MKILTKALLITIFSSVCVGCSTVKNKELTSDDSLTLNNKTIAVSRYSELPDFAAQTAVNVQFGLLGVATAVSSGNDMIKNNEIGDPASLISAQLLAGLEDSYTMSEVKVDSSLPAKSEMDDVISTYGKADYILDVKTIGWSSIHFSSDWDNYRVTYTAHARLIDVKNKIAIMDDTCSYTPEYADTNQAPTYDELENGAGLKTALTKSVEFCVTQIRRMAKLHNQTNKDYIGTAE